MSHTRLLRRRDERGTSAVEYSLLAALIAVVIIFAALLLGGNTNALYECTGDSIVTQGPQC